MTEEGKSPKNQSWGFPFFFGKRKERVSHIPTARLLLLISSSEAKAKTKPERSIPHATTPAPSGSFFNWKRLRAIGASEEQGFSNAPISQYAAIPISQQNLII
jgi:hypothetical protein